MKYHGQVVVTREEKFPRQPVATSDGPTLVPHPGRCTGGRMQQLFSRGP